MDSKSPRGRYIIREHQASEILKEVTEPATEKQREPLIHALKNMLQQKR